MTRKTLLCVMVLSVLAGCRDDSVRGDLARLLSAPEEDIRVDTVPSVVPGVRYFTGGYIPPGWQDAYLERTLVSVGGRIQEVEEPEALLRDLTDAVGDGTSVAAMAVDLCFEAAAMAGPGATRLFPPRLYHAGLQLDNPIGADALEELRDSVLAGPVRATDPDGVVSVTLWSIERAHARLYKCSWGDDGPTFVVRRQVSRQFSF